MTPQRRDLLDAVAARLRAQDPGHPLRIGVDGVCGSGKTTFADELALLLAEGPRPVIRLDSDGFHNERAVRYRQGRDSARGYYEDAYALDSLRLLTLEPLGPDGTRRYAEHLHDLETDLVAPRFADAADDAILLFDATFIQRDDLRDHWDEVIYLDAPREHALARGVERDVARGADADASRELYDSRYLAACDIYLEEQDPRTRASILIDHADPSLPRLLR